MPVANHQIAATAAGITIADESAMTEWPKRLAASELEATSAVGG